MPPVRLPAAGKPGIAGSIPPSSRQQFCGSNNPKRLEEFGADPILPAVPTGQGKLGCACDNATYQLGQHGVVLIVRMAPGMGHVHTDGRPGDRLRWRGGRLAVGVAPRPFT
jgi:hypothetical protein